MSSKDSIQVTREPARAALSNRRGKTVCAASIPMELRYRLARVGPLDWERARSTYDSIRTSRNAVGTLATALGEDRRGVGRPSRAIL
ncbi:uncharacterized protein J3R85_012061 [Psidium guajava]|nr:uncharacterized protein J3R85_012061 [Psidium guajava]